MARGKAIFAWMALLFCVITTSGCALVGTLISAGISYGIYQATRN